MSEALKGLWFIIVAFFLLFLMWVVLKSPTPSGNGVATSTGGALIPTTLSAGNAEQPTSIYKDSVRIQNVYSARESDPNKEFIAIEAPIWNKETVVVTGWSLKTATGRSVVIGRGANVFRQGVINEEDVIGLSSGERLYVVSGRSPLGVAFHENMCSGYLAQYQSFTPAINNHCPTATEDLWKRNLASDNSCSSFAASVPSCTTPRNLFLYDLSQSCTVYAQTDLTYNGCVALHKNDFDFFRDGWYFYIGDNKEVWSNVGGLVRLYDADGRLVDSLIY